MTETPYTEFEFLTCLQYGDHEYVGIVVNSDNHLITFYDLEMLPNTEAPTDPDLILLPSMQFNLSNQLRTISSSSWT